MGRELASTWPEESIFSTSLHCSSEVSRLPGTGGGNLLTLRSVKMHILWTQTWMWRQGTSCHSVNQAAPLGSSAVSFGILCWDSFAVVLFLIYFFFSFLIQKCSLSAHKESKKRQRLPWQNKLLKTPVQCGAFSGSVQTVEPLFLIHIDEEAKLSIDIRSM